MYRVRVVWTMCPEGEMSGIMWDAEICEEIDSILGSVSRLPQQATADADPNMEFIYYGK